MAKKQLRGGAERLAELEGAPPRLASPEDLEAAGPRTGRQHPVSRQSMKPHGINLRAVSEALVEEGLDPATEFARILRGRPAVDAGGNPVIDPVTGDQARVYDLDTDVRARMLGEILQYVQPKLKAVEVKMSGMLELSDDQLNARLEALLAKAARG